MVEWEKKAYGFDHTLIGITLIDCWNLDPEIGTALLAHHEEGDVPDPASLDALLRMADYLAWACGLGFFAEPSLPPAPLWQRLGCEEEAEEVLFE